MYELPTSIILNDTEYKIRNNGDYRVILDVITACQDVDLTDVEQAVTALMIFYEDINDFEDIWLNFDDPQQAINKMMDFIACGQDNEIGQVSNHKLIDWEQDELLIVSAINNVTKTEIRAMPYLHWWTFISYYMAIGDCSLSNIVSIRDKIARGKKLEKYEQDFRRQNPQYFTFKTKLTQEELELEKYIEDIWNKE